MFTVTHEMSSESLTYDCGTYDTLELALIVAHREIASTAATNEVTSVSEFSFDSITYDGPSAGKLR